MEAHGHHILVLIALRMNNSSVTIESEFDWILPPDADKLSKILNYITAVVIMFGNSLTIASVVKFEWLRSNTNILICSLSCADFYVGVISFIYHLSYSIGTVSDQMFVIIFTLLSIGYMSSVLHLATIAIERFVGVNYPLRYHSIISPKMIKMFIISSWGMSIMFGIVSMTILYTLGTNNYLYIDLTNNFFYLFSGLVIGIVYLTMLPSIYKQSKAIRQQATSENAKIRQEIKACITLGIVLVAYLICWTPYFVMNIVMWSNKLTTAMYTAWTFSLLLSTANSAVNFFIYAWRSKEFRRAYITIMTCGRKTGRVDDVTTTQSLNSTERA